MTMSVLAIIVMLIVIVFGYIYYSSKKIANEGANSNNQYKNFGFSYIAVAQVLNMIVALLLGFASGVFLLEIFSNDKSIELAVVIGIPVALLIYYFLNFSIIKFRNNAIIAKTNTEILEELKKLSDK